MNLEENRRVLIIDDNESIHADFRKIIGSNGEHENTLDSATAALFDEAPLASTPHRGYEVDTARQGQEGLACVGESIRQGRPYADGVCRYADAAWLERY